MPDDVKDSGPSSSETELEQDATEEPQSPSDGVKPESGQSEAKAKTVPYSRFQTVNAKAQEYEKVVKWYQEQVPDADELLAFKSWKAEQAKSAKEKKAPETD